MANKSIEHTRRSLAELWNDWNEPFVSRWFDWTDMPFPAFKDAERLLRVEEFTEGDDLVVRAEMPGIDPEQDVDVHVREHVLEIRAERKAEETREEKGMTRSEFRYGSFYRAISLPAGAKENEVQATYKDGILEVRVPLDSKGAQESKIAVKRG
jgi:HSP20 family protein